MALTYIFKFFYYSEIMVSEETYSFMKCINILGKNETYNDMVVRVFSTLAQEGRALGATEQEIAYMDNRLSHLFRNECIVPGTPILANAGRHNNKPLSACSVPSLNNGLSRREIYSLVEDYQRKGMGTGFNFDDSDDPVSDLLLLNELSVKQTEKRELERPAASMAVLSIDHPKIYEFASCKSGEYKADAWKFNISINVTRAFLNALENGDKHILKDGKEVSAADLFYSIVCSAHECGDPGLVFLERFEEHNITPHLGKYVSFAPCGEIAMASGETCQFSYINLAKFVDGRTINYECLEETVEMSVKLLDNALEITAKNIGNEKSEELIRMKRKIGIGVCGFSDMLVSLGLPYDSKEAQSLAEDLMSFINYASKKSSVALAEERGPFPAFDDPETRRDLILRRYLDLNSNTVKKSDWKKLEASIYSSGIRNVSTTAIPPTGKSALIIGASPAIEPIFRLSPDDVRGYLSGSALKTVEQTGSCQKTDIPKNIRNIYKTCLELSPEAHIQMVAAFQKYTDESIAKTVNLPTNTTPEDVMRTYLLAHDLGLKGITIFRDGCKEQPIKLSI